MDVPGPLAPDEKGPADNPEVKKEQEENDQIIRLDEDLSGGNIDELPF